MSDLDRRIIQAMMDEADDWHLVDPDTGLEVGRGSGTPVTPAQLKSLLAGESVVVGATRRVVTLADGPFSIVERGGKGSGHFGHRGIPKHRGGSLPSKGGTPSAHRPALAGQVPDAVADAQPVTRAGARRWLALKAADFSPEQREVMADLIANWNISHGTLNRLWGGIVDRGSATWQENPGSAYYTQVYRDEASGKLIVDRAMGLFGGDDMTIHIPVETDPKNLPDVLCHELGHLVSDEFWHGGGTETAFQAMAGTFGSMTVYEQTDYIRWFGLDWGAFHNYREFCASCFVVSRLGSREQIEALDDALSGTEEGPPSTWRTEPEPEVTVWRPTCREVGNVLALDYVAVEVPVSVAEACPLYLRQDPYAPLSIVRHYGPGPHPGTGTEQEAHAGGRASVSEEALPGGKRIVRIVSVEDTREFIEGPDDKWHPVPGTGQTHECARCGKDHEIHATVQLENGEQIVVGTTCMTKEFSEAQRKQMGSMSSTAATIARLESEQADVNHYLEVYDREIAAVRAQERPPITFEERTTDMGTTVGVAHMGTASQFISADRWRLPSHGFDEGLRAQLDYTWIHGQLAGSLREAGVWNARLSTYRPTEKARDIERRLDRARGRMQELQTPPTERSVLRHYGPGPHPGTGTEQQVHAGGDAGVSTHEQRRQGPKPERSSVKRSTLDPYARRVIHSIARDAARRIRQGTVKDLDEFLQRWRAGDESLHCLWRPTYLTEEVTKALYGGHMGEADEEEVYRQIGLLIRESVEKEDAQEEAAERLILERENYQVQESRDVGDLLSVPAGDKWDGVRHAAEVIDSVHTIPDVTMRIADPTATLQLDVRETVAETKGGHYVARGSQAVNIAINLEGSPEDDAETTVHEVGHLIDHLVLGGGAFGSDSAWAGFHTVTTSSGAIPEAVQQREEDLRGVMQAIKDSDTYQAVVAWRAGSYTVTEPDGQTTEYYTPARTARVIRSPGELFARAYSQWVTIRSGDGALQTELQRGLTRQQGGGTPYQWPLADFEPIREAFDRLFRRQGWLRSS